MRIALGFSAILLALSSSAFAGQSGVTYQGRILKPDGSPLAGQFTQFRMQIRTPNANDCLMYEEIQTLDMRLTSGAFSLTMADGSGTRTDTSGLGLNRLFENRGAFTFAPATCTSGSSYTPSDGDGRNLVVYFKDETMGTWEPIPPQKINYVPYAFSAQSVQGYGADSLLRVVNGSGDPITGLAPLSNTQYTALMDLVNGSSAAYTKAGQLNGVALPTMTTGEVLGWNGSAWISQAAAGGANSVTTTTIQDGAVTGAKLDPAISISTSGMIASAVTTTRDFKIYAASPSSFYVGMLADPALAASYTLTWPLNAGSANQVLTTDGSGKLTWTTPSPGGVTSWNSRTGAVSPQANDYTWAQIDKTTSSLADLTTRSASDLSSGTLNDSRLSSNVALKNAANDFTNKNTITTATAANEALQLKSSDDNQTKNIFEVRDSGNALKASVRPDGVPTTPTDLTTKAYVDNAVSSVPVGNYVLKTGDTMTGPLVNNTSDAASALAITQSGAGPSATLMGGNVGIGTTAPNGNLDVKGSIVMSGATSGFTGFQPSATAGSTIYTLPSSLTAGGYLTTDGSGNLTWSTPAGTGVTSVTSSNTDIGIANTMTTPVLTLNSGTGPDQILKLDGSSKIPAVDGSQLTNLNASSFMSGTLPVSRGGTGTTSFANYSVIASDVSGNQVAVPGSTSNTMLQWDVTGPKWSAAVWPSSTTANQLLYSSANNVVGQLATSNNGVLVTDGTGVPSIDSSLPSAVQGNITSVGTVTSGTWNGTAIAANHGGTGQTAYTVGDLLYADTASTLAKLPAAANGYVLTSNGAGTAPSWQAATSGMGGSGTANYLPKFTAGTTLADSAIYETGGKVGIGTTSPSTALDIVRSTGANIRSKVTSAGTAAMIVAENEVTAHQVSLGMYSPAIVGSGAIQPDGAWLGANGAGGLSISSFNSSAPIRFYTAGIGDPQERMRITSAGNVGIGTTSPAYKLDVAGDVNVTGNFKVNGVNISTGGGDFMKNGSVAMTGAFKAIDGTALTPSITFDSDSDTGLYQAANNSIGFSSGGYVTLQINGGGSGAYIERGRMKSDGGLAGNPSLGFAGDTTTGFYLPSSGALGISTAGSEQIRVTSGGNVGIGTTSPGARMEIFKSSGVLPTNFGTAGNALIRLSASGIITSNVLDMGTSSSGPWLQATDSTDLSLNQSLLLNPNGGNVGIGTTSPVYKLDVNGVVNATGLKINGVDVAAGGGDFKKDGSVSMTGAFKASAGTGAAPSISFAGDTNTGFYNEYGDDSIDISLGGNHAAAMTPFGTSFFTPLGVYNGSAGQPDFELKSNSSSGTGLYSSATNAIGFATNSTEKMRITAAGKVGIGTTSPNTTLDVAGTIKGSFTQTGASAADGASFTTTTDVNGTALTGNLNGLTVSSTAMKVATSGSVTGLRADALQLAYAGGTVTGISGQASVQAGATATAAYGGNFSLQGSGVTTGYGVYIGNLIGTTKYGLYQLDNTARNYFGGSVGIGTTSPAYKLDVNGVVNATGLKINGVDVSAGGGGGDFMKDGSVAMTGALKAATGSAGAPSITFASDLDTGLYSSAANRVAFAAGGAKAFEIMGTSNAYISNGILRAASGSTGAPGISFENNNKSGLYSPAGFTLGLVANNIEAVRIDSTGNVGVGTTDPQAPLEINANVADSTSHPNRGGVIVRGGGATGIGGRFVAQSSSDSYAPLFMGMRSRGTVAAPTQVQSGDTLAYFMGIGRTDSGWPASGGTASQIGIRATENHTNSAQGSEIRMSTVANGTTDATSHVLIANDGRIAVGIDIGSLVTPASAFEVRAPNQATSAGTGVAAVFSTDTQGADLGGSLTFGGQDGTSSNRAFAQISGRKSNGTSGNYDGYLVLATRPNGGSMAERMRIDASGNVGIGTTVPETMLDVTGTASFGSTLENTSAYVNSGSAYTVPDTSLNIRRLNLTADTTITLPAFTSTGVRVYNLTLFLKQDATGGRAVTFAGNGSDTIKWDSGMAPPISAAAGHITIIQLMKTSDENIWYGSMTWRED